MGCIADDLAPGCRGLYRGTETNTARFVRNLDYIPPGTRTNPTKLKLMDPPLCSVCKPCTIHAAVGGDGAGAACCCLQLLRLTIRTLVEASRIGRTVSGYLDGVLKLNTHKKHNVVGILFHVLPHILSAVYLKATSDCKS